MDGMSGIASSPRGVSRRLLQLVEGAAISSVAILGGAFVAVYRNRDLVGNYLASSVLCLVIAAVPFALIAFRIRAREEKRGLALAITWGTLFLVFTTWQLVESVAAHLRGDSSSPQILVGALLWLASCVLVASAIKAYYTTTGEAGDKRTILKAVGESAIGLALISVVGAVAIPPMGHNPKGNQALAVRSIRKIHECAARYAIYHANRGFPRTLVELGPGGDDCLDARLAQGVRSSYVFTYVAGAPDSTGRVTRFSLRAEPTHFEEGVVRYFSDQTGTIRWTAGTREAGPQDKPVQ
jgi:hypothetical protein